MCSTALRTNVAATLLLVVFVGCNTPTEPDGGPCASEASFCGGRVVQALTPEQEWYWRKHANDWVDAQYGASTHLYPHIVYHPCFFAVGNVCAAGWTESAGRIHVSTAEPNRTGPLICHETAHARYWHQFGDPDEKHRRKYPC